MSSGAQTSGKTFDRSIVEGPIPGVMWKLAGPTMLQNVLGGLQGIVDHAMVGHFVGFAGNAAIGAAVPPLWVERVRVAREALHESGQR